MISIDWSIEIYISGAKPTTTLTIATTFNTTQQLCMYQIEFTKSDSTSVRLAWKPVIKSPHSLLYKVSFYDADRQHLASATTTAYEVIASYNEGFINNIHFASIQAGLKDGLKGPLFWKRITKKQCKD